MEETDFKTHHSRYGLPARLVAFVTFYTGGFSSLTWLHRCSDCYRAERISSQAGLAPAVDHHLSRRTRLSRLASLSQLTVHGGCE